MGYNLKLTTLEAKLLQYLDLRADEELPPIARKLKVPMHKLHYTLARLHEKGILEGKVALIDYGRLGRTPYSLLLGIAPFGPRQRKTLSDFFSSMPEVAWASEVLGSAPVSLQTFLNSPYQVTDILRLMQKKAGVRIVSKEVVVRHSLTVFERRYLSSEKSNWERAQIIFDDSARFTNVAPVTLDEIDWQCLAAIAVPHTGSLAAIARNLKLPAQTFHRRITNLRKQGVLRGFMHAVRLRELGVRRYKLLISTFGYDPALEKALRQVATNHEHVTNFAVCLGQWDFEISIETFDDRIVSQTLGELSEQFGPALREIRVLPVLEYFKFSFLVANNVASR